MESHKTVRVFHGHAGVLQVFSASAPSPKPRAQRASLFKALYKEVFAKSPPKVGSLSVGAWIWRVKAASQRCFVVSGSLQVVQRLARVSALVL